VGLLIDFEARELALLVLLTNAGFLLMGFGLGGMHASARWRKWASFRGYVRD
jgi:hypothetical protein